MKLYIQTLVNFGPKAYYKFSSDKELGGKVGGAEEDEEGVGRNGGPGQRARLAQAGQVHQARQQEHHHQAAGGPAAKVQQQTFIR